MERIKHTNGRRILLILAGMLLGAGLVLGIRYYRVAIDHTHYHANFAVFIDGEREEFSEPGFYEEIASCAPHGSDPALRAHMHRPDNDVIHVHDDLVTWGNFFENIGFSISDRHIGTNTRIYVNTNESRVVFWLNGEEVRNPANTVIQDEDSLLISYGAGGEQVLREQYQAIDHGKAAVANRQDDPDTCGGEVNDWRHILGELL